MKYTKTETVQINDIVFDPANPNEMSEQEITGLTDLMNQYGIAVDPWLNKRDDKYHVIDGEHRIKIIQETQKSVKAKVFDNLSDNEVRLLRQAANKLRGRHNFEKDIAEFKILQEAGLLEDLAKYTNKRAKDYEQLLEGLKPKDIDVEAPETLQCYCINPTCDHGKSD